MAEVEYSVTQLAEALGAELKGDGAIKITGMAPLQAAQSGQLSFLDNPSYKKYLATTQASAVILSAKEAVDCPVTALIVDNPYVGYAKVANLFDRQPQPESGVHATAVIGADCDIHPSASIGPHCVIGNAVTISEGAVIGAHASISDNCQIGAGTCLMARVTLYHGTVIGKQCTLHSGVVLGSDGFGMAKDQGAWVKIPQLGRVIIADNVEIGANTTVDRGALGDTTIAEGVKLDNQIQVAHNVAIGAHTAIAGCTAIAGSTTIGAHCMIGGGTCISGHLSITDNVALAGMAGVYGSIDKPGVYASGVPLQPYTTARRNSARFGQLNQMANRLRALEKKFEQEFAKQHERESED